MFILYKDHTELARASSRQLIEDVKEIYEKQFNYKNLEIKEI